MTELDDDLRQHLLRAYQSKGPSAVERARVLSSLESALAAGATVTTLSAAGKGSLKSFLLAHSVAVSGIGFGIGCAVVLSVWLSRGPAEPAAPTRCVAPCGAVRPAETTGQGVPAAPAASASASVEAALGAGPKLPAVGDAAAVPSASTVIPWSRKRPVVRGDDLAAEAALLHQAHSAYRRGRPAETLSLLQQHITSYPSSQLSVERSTLKALALCALRRTDEARRLAATLPSSSTTALRGTCAER